MEHEQSLQPLEKMKPNTVCIYGSPIESTTTSLQMLQKRLASLREDGWELISPILSRECKSEEIDGICS